MIKLNVDDALDAVVTPSVAVRVKFKVCGGVVYVTPTPEDGNEYEVNGEPIEMGKPKPPLLNVNVAPLTVGIPTGLYEAATL